MSVQRKVMHCSTYNRPDKTDEQRRASFGPMHPVIRVKWLDRTILDCFDRRGGPERLLECLDVVEADNCVTKEWGV